MKKIIMGLVLSLMMAANIFATDLVKYNTYETEIMGTIDVYFDYEATEPFDIKNESIRHFLFLQNVFEDVEVWLENIEDWWLYSEAVKHNCYAIRILHIDFYIDIYIHDDNTVTVYSYRDKEEE